MSSGVVSAAPSAASAPTLISAEAIKPGTVFLFQVSGKLAKSQLNGSVHVVNGEDYDLYCSQVDAETVRCTTPRMVQGNVVVTFNGFLFWTFVRPRSSEPTEYCYGVYDWDVETATSWAYVGDNCQSDPATYGDVIQYYNPDWDDTYDYEFMPSSPACSFTRPGDAYYYNDCPGSGGGGGGI
ncbi:MAG: hypothetical protein QY306_02365 [Anaerolineales bacterium]|nr:MAG: hypothetical protein QY306_02365 [Anaerolineales bacterium]